MSLTTLRGRYDEAQGCSDRFTLWFLSPNLCCAHVTKLYSWLNTCMCIYACVSLSFFSAHALPMFREARQRSTKKQLEKDRLDPMKSHKPEPPVSGPGDVKPLMQPCSLSRALRSWLQWDLERGSE